MSKSFGRKILSKLSLKSSRSAPSLIDKQNEKSDVPRQTNSSLTNIKSAVEINNQTNSENSQQHLDLMHKIVDETDENLRRAVEQAAIRHEQLDQLHFRSQEMLQKNENLVFGITNYRKTQERDLFWRRFQYTAFGAITIGIIILLIILSMTSKRSASSSQIIDIRHSNQDLPNKTNQDITSTLPSSTSQRRRRRRRIYT